MSYQKIMIPKAVVYLTPEEVHHLLLSDIELFKQALIRGKAFSRNQSLVERVEAKKQG